MILVNQFIDFFLPRFCPSCKNRLNPDNNFICDVCLSKIKIADEELIQNEYKRKFTRENFISDFHSLYVFEKEKEFQNIIHEIKYNENFRLGLFIGQLIAVNLKDKIQSWSPDLIVPIPLHHLKKAERGYNQSYYLAKGISVKLDIPVYDNIIARTKFTPSQTNLDLKERKENIEGAFKIKNGKKYIGKRIILIDDVITTGATITECAKVLIDAGAEKVFALSAAIAEL